MEKEITEKTPTLRISTVVDVFDQTELFRALTNDDILKLSRQNDQAGFSGTKAIQRSTGITERRVLQQGVQVVDVAAALCQRLKSVTETALPEFHRVLLCHSHTNPQQCVELVTELERRLQLPSGTFQPRNFGCSGYMKLLAEGRDLLQDAPASAKVALLSVETPETWHDSSDRLFCGIVSAGATATVLERQHGLPVAQVVSGDYEISADRRTNSEPLFERDLCDGYDFDGEACRRSVMRMNPEPVFINGIELMLDQLRAALETVDRTGPERIVVVPHQPSGKLLKALIAAAKSEFGGVEFLNNLPWYGNTISSTVPTVLSRLAEVFADNDLPPLKEGDHLILLAAGICMEEIGNHMSAGHACLRWAPDALNSIKTQEAAANVP